MVGQEVQTTLKVAIREDVYSGCAEYPAAITWLQVYSSALGLQTNAAPGSKRSQADS